MSARKRKRIETAAFAVFVRRVIAAHGRRAAVDVEALVELRDLTVAVLEALRDAVRAVHASGYSWADIARRLGMTRQGVFKRFGT